MDYKEELFDSLVVLENYPLTGRICQQNGSNELCLNSYSIVETTHYDLTVSIIMMDAIEVNFIYNNECLLLETIKRLSAHFCQIMENIIENPDKRIHELDMLSVEEKRQLSQEASSPQ